MNGGGDYSRSVFEKVLNGASFVFVFILFFLPILFWQSVPDHIPQHFNFSGEVDSWGGKCSLFILPIAGLVAFGILSFVCCLPGAGECDDFIEECGERQYMLSRVFGTLLKVWFLAIFAYVEWRMILIAQGSATDIGVGSGTVFGGVFIGITLIYVGAVFLSACTDRRIEPGEE